MKDAMQTALGTPQHLRRVVGREPGERYAGANTVGQDLEGGRRQTMGGLARGRKSEMLG